MMLKILQRSHNTPKVAYRDVGQGEALVLIHGVGMQSAAWEPQIEALSKHYRVIAIDMPGHGQSDALPETSELEDFVEWLHTTLVAMDVGPVNLAGHSMGAMISGGYVMSHPSMVRRVALLNGVYRRTPEARSAVISRAVEIRNGKVDLETPLQRWFGDSAVDQAARKQVSQWLRDVDLSGYATAYGAFARGDGTYADGWSKVSCPMLALTGDGDPNSTPAMAVAMTSEAQNGVAEVIEDHRHMINLTAPDEVNRILLNWLQQPEIKKE